MDYLIPTALEVPDWETGFTVTPSPHHPIGAKGVGESATVGSPPAIVNAVVDALEPFGVRHADMPLTPVPGVGRHAGPAPRRRSDEQAGDREPTAGCSCRTPARAVRARHRGARAAADLGARRRRRDRARRRVDRGLRRRPVRGGLGAHRRAATPCGRGETVLLRVLPGRRAGFPEAPGAPVVVNPCLSGGALEIFLEPVLPAGAGRVVGDTPIAEAVAELARLPGLRPVDRVDSRRGVRRRRRGRGGRPGRRRRRGGARRRRWTPGCAYVALVASPRRGAAVLAELGLTEAERARIHTPVGLHIGARTARRSRCRSWPRSSRYAGWAGRRAPPPRR